MNNIDEWKRLRVELLKMKPLQRITKLEGLIKKVDNRIILEDIIELIKRTAVELDVFQSQQGGTVFQPSRLERIERRDEPRVTVDDRVEFVPIQRTVLEEESNKTYQVEETDDEHGYTSKSYFTKADSTYKQDEFKSFESPSEEFLREGFDNNLKKYKKGEGK